MRIKVSGLVARPAVETDNIREELKADAAWVANFVAKHGYAFPESMFMPDGEVQEIGNANANPAV